MQNYTNCSKAVIRFCARTSLYIKLKGSYTSELVRQYFTLKGCVEGRAIISLTTKTTNTNPVSRSPLVTNATLDPQSI